LTADGVEVPALHVAEPGHGFPDAAAAGPHVDRILGLPEADDERRSVRIVRDHGVEVSIEHRAQAFTIAIGLRERVSRRGERQRQADYSQRESRHDSPSLQRSLVFLRRDNYTAGPVADIRRRAAAPKRAPATARPAHASGQLMRALLVLQFWNAGVVT